MCALRLGSLSFDCADPLALATFWADVLGGDIAFTSDAFVAIKLEHIWMSAVKVDNYEPPTWPDGDVPQQLHLDVAVDDLDESEQLVVHCGARKAKFQPEPERWRVFFDPAGHPFCLSTQIPE